MKGLFIQNKAKYISFYKGEGIGGILSEYCYCLLENIKTNHPLTIETEIIDTIDHLDNIIDYYNRVKNKNGVIVSGPVSGAKVYELREKLGLLFKIIEIKPKSYSKRFSPLRRDLIENTDIVVLRENLDGPYFANFVNNNNSISAEVSYSTERIKACAKFAYKIARERKGIITLVGKEDVSGCLYRYWIKTFNSYNEQNPTIKFRFVNVDRFISDVLINSEKFDVVVAPNTEADAFTDVLVECFCGSRNNGYSININEAQNFYVTQTIHGSGKDIDAVDKINPIGHISATIAALRCINENLIANKLSLALDKTINSLDYFNPHDPDMNNIDLSTLFEVITKYIDE